MPPAEAGDATPGGDFNIDLSRSFMMGDGESDAAGARKTFDLSEERGKRVMRRAALIMAGGKGERFWPKSRARLPKQFLPLTDDQRTLIQLTVERVLKLVDVSDVYVVTNEGYRAQVLDQLPELPRENVICEPVGRNTAPCIGLGAERMAKRYGEQDAVMLVIPSDHLVRDERAFVDTLAHAFEAAEEGKTLVTIGIVPDRPETEYGYIQFRPGDDENGACGVERFVEKPHAELARAYLSSGDYLWNSGMFVWKVSTILSAIREYLPDIGEKLEQIGEAMGTTRYESVLKKIFATMRSISIDYGVMEKASSIRVLKGDFGWDDVGSWLALERVRGCDAEGNVTGGEVVLVNSRNVIAEGHKRLIAGVGLENLVIVDTDDVVLVCDKGHTGEIKALLEEIRRRKGNQYV